MQQLMRNYTYKKYGELDAYGQPTLGDGGTISMAISIISNQISDNVMYRDAQYIGLTKGKLDDKCVVTYGNDKLNAAHYGRDALVGVALFLTLLAKSGKRVSELKKQYPAYAIAKNKVELTPEVNVDAILKAIKTKYASEKITDIDGVKIDFKDSWVHLRKSNTEPIIRIYSEAKTLEEAQALGESIKKVIINKEY